MALGNNKKRHNRSRLKLAEHSSSLWLYSTNSITSISRHYYAPAQTWTDDLAVTMVLGLPSFPNYAVIPLLDSGICMLFHILMATLRLVRASWRRFRISTWRNVVFCIDRYALTAGFTLSTMVNTVITSGVWQDYSYPGWQGSILTLDIQKSTILVSALATFITLVGARAWALIAFIIHQSRASSKEKDGIHHQRRFFEESIRDRVNL